MTIVFRPNNRALFEHRRVSRIRVTVIRTMLLLLMAVLTGEIPIRASFLALVFIMDITQINTTAIFLVIPTGTVALPIRLRIDGAMAIPPGIGITFKRHLWIRAGYACVGGVIDPFTLTAVLTTDRARECG